MKLESSCINRLFIDCISSIAFIPRGKWLQAQFVFLFVQFLTWISGFCVVELRLLEYPYRELSRINRTSFVFEYLLLPLLCVHLNARFPNRAARPVKIGLYAGITSVLTAVEFLLERYTDVIKYIGWEWYWTFISVWLVLWLSRTATGWFFKKGGIL
jgi:hypothetical protein